MDALWSVRGHSSEKSARVVATRISKVVIGSRSFAKELDDPTACNTLNDLLGL